MLREHVQLTLREHVQLTLREHVQLTLREHVQLTLREHVQLLVEVILDAVRRIDRLISWLVCSVIQDDRLASV